METNFLISTNHQKVLSLLAKFSDKEFYEREVARKIGISFGSANKVLNELYSDGLLTRVQKGKMYFYRINSADPVFQQFKILNTIVLLSPLINELKFLARKVTLYGSCAKGADSSESDIDIFIVSDNKQNILRLVEKYSLGKGFEEVKIQPVILSPLEFLKSEKIDKEFLSLVEEGIVLWEKITDESGV
jgi:predicted nucleotidyltransferase